MAIILVPQPGSTPSDLTDWTKSVESLKQYNLGVNNPVDYNFDGNTIKKGVLITIGGSNYYCNADTAISGTASDYVKITSGGVASYVSSLSGVSWNDTYNFYADSSGNAYIFNEAKAGLANTVIGAFAEHGYFTEMEVMGVASFESDEIIMYQPVTVDGNALSILGTSPRIHLWETGSISSWTLLADADHLYVRNGGTFGDTVLKFSKLNNILIGTETDNGVDKLQVAGSASFSGAIKTQGSGQRNLALDDTDGQVYSLFTRATDNNFGMYDGTNEITFFRYIGNSSASSTVLKLLETGGNVLIGTTTDNGVNKLQVNGSVSATGINTGHGVVECYAMDQALLTTSSPTLGALAINRSGGQASISAGSVGGGDMIIDCYESSDVLALNYYTEGNTWINALGGNVLIGTTTDNGTDKLQVAGSASFSDAISAGSASFSGAINPTSTPTSSTMTTNGTIPRGLYRVIPANGTSSTWSVTIKQGGAPIFEKTNDGGEYSYTLLSDGVSETVTFTGGASLLLYKY